MNKVVKKLSQLAKRQFIASWIALIATVLLTAEILWTIGNVWENVSLWAQIAIIMATFLVVIIFGWRRKPLMIK